MRLFVKIVLRIVLVVVVFFLLRPVWLFMQGEVENTYSTRKDAEEDQLFQRGWLPDMIPESARFFWMRNDAEANTSIGTFGFSPGDFEGFAAEMKELERSVIEEARQGELMEEGFRAFAFRNQRAEWVFLVHPESGRCEYWMKSSVGTAGDS